MSKRALALTVAGATALGVVASMAPASASPAKGKLPYVVMMAELPAVAYEGGLAGLPATKPAEGEKINARSKKVTDYAGHLKRKQKAALTGAGVAEKPVNQMTTAANAFAVQLTEAEAERMREQQDVLVVVKDTMRQKQTDASPTFLGLNGKGQAWATGLTGEGVTVGVIDTGIWPEHPSFADPGLKRPEGLPDNIPCEFGDTSYNPADKPFTCQNKLIGARDMRTLYKLLQGPEVYNSARDYDGHGTHTASTAAGNAHVKASIFGIDRGTVSGIAPKASIIAYSALGEGGGYGSDLAAAIDQAVADGVDVLNYSIGSSSPTVGPDDIAFLFAADSGVRVATSNGNAGPNAGTIGSPAQVPWVTSVGASTHNRGFNAIAKLGNGKQYKGASVTEALPSKPLVDAAALGNPLCLEDKAFNPAPTGKIVLCERGTNARVAKGKAVHDAGGAGMILFNNNDAMALITDSHWLPAVHVNNTNGLAIKAYIELARGNAKATLTQGVAEPAKGSVMADFSSRGPNMKPASDNIIKPDVTAPGVNILAGNTPTPGDGRPGQLFQSISGTSMSSPEVAGLMALSTQANPDWSPAAVKSSLMTTARQDVFKEDGKSQADPFDMGAGHVNPGKVRAKGSMFNPGIVYDADTLDYVGYVCGSAENFFTSTLCNGVKESGRSFEASQLNLASMASSAVAGSKTFTRTVTNVSDNNLNLKAQVDVPAGFAVEVTPVRIRMKPGEKATFTVKVSNESSAVGDWKFGALTWKGSGYQARSPIALKASALQAPAEVTGTGAVGTGTAEVSFGYTGPYSVDSFGLAAEERTAGSVGQDPNGSFSPGDVGNGATRHDVDLTGTKFFRMTLNQADLTGPTAGAADLDVYVYSLATGRLVAQSGAGDTNEVIELKDPAAGQYAVFVHGWGTGGQVVNYNFHSWKVSSTPNAGTLKVTDAPASATLGQTGKITYSWSGVAAGTTGLGLLSHKDANGEMGTTLVTIKN